MQYYQYGTDNLAGIDGLFEDQKRSQFGKLVEVAPEGSEGKLQ